MARQGNLKYQGTIGGIIYYKLYDDFFKRAKPVLVRQTKATRASALMFGKAVKTGKALRQALQPLLPVVKDVQLMFRLNTALCQWLRSRPSATMADLQVVETLYPFQLNKKIALAERLKLVLQTEWQQNNNALLVVPAMRPVSAISAPAHTTRVTLRVVAAVISMHDYTLTAMQQRDIVIPYTDAVLPEQELQFPITIAPHSIAVMAVCLRYTKSTSSFAPADKRLPWLPAAIIRGVYRGKA